MRGAQVGVCFANYRNLKSIARARVVWAGARLQVWLDMEHSNSWQLCLQTEKDDKRLVMPSPAYFGITASTGDYADSHVLYSFSAAALDENAKEISHTPQKDAHVTKDHVVHHESADHHMHDHVKVGKVRHDAAEMPRPGGGGGRRCLNGAIPRGLAGAHIVAQGRDGARGRAGGARDTGAARAGACHSRPI